jgi:chemotaxis protein histidine kinase CheA
LAVTIITASCSYLEKLDSAAAAAAAEESSSAATEKNKFEAAMVEAARVHAAERATLEAAVVKASEALSEEIEKVKATEIDLAVVRATAEAAKSKAEDDLAAAESKAEEDLAAFKAKAETAEAKAAEDLAAATTKALAAEAKVTAVQEALNATPGYVLPFTWSHSQLATTDQGAELVADHWRSWSAATGLARNGYRLSLIISSDPEWAAVAAKLAETLPKAVIQEILRVENPRLYESYAQVSTQILITTISEIIVSLEKSQLGQVSLIRMMSPGYEARV